VGEKTEAVTGETEAEGGRAGRAHRRLLDALCCAVTRPAVAAAVAAAAATCAVVCVAGAWRGCAAGRARCLGAGCGCCGLELQR